MDSPPRTATEDDRKKLCSLTRDVHIVMLTTMDRDGSLRARPMANKDNDFSDALCFLTQASAHTALEVGRNDEVCLCFADPGLHTYVSVSGRARLTRDTAKAKELWSPYAKIWFPDGIDDPDLAILAVEPERAEYWDSPSSAFVAIFGLLPLLAGRPPRLGDNQKIDFN